MLRTWRGSIWMPTTQYSLSLQTMLRSHIWPYSSSGKKVSFLHLQWVLHHHSCTLANSESVLRTLVHQSTITFWCWRRHIVWRRAVSTMCKHTYLTKSTQVLAIACIYVKMSQSKSFAIMSICALHQKHSEWSICYADKGKDIELRHQRNPDVTFDCVRASPGELRLWNCISFKTWSRFCCTIESCFLQHISTLPCKG